MNEILAELIGSIFAVAVALTLWEKPYQILHMEGDKRAMVKSLIIKMVTYTAILFLVVHFFGDYLFRF